MGFVAQSCYAKLQVFPALSSFSRLFFIHITSFFSDVSPFSFPFHCPSFLSCQPFLIVNYLLLTAQYHFGREMRPTLNLLNQTHLEMVIQGLLAYPSQVPSLNWESIRSEASQSRLPEIAYDHQIKSGARKCVDLKLDA